MARTPLGIQYPGVGEVVSGRLNQRFRELAETADAAISANGGGSADPPYIQVFTNAGTWSKPAGLLAVRVCLVGGGGGGGGAEGTGSGQVSGGAGGNAGVYAESVIPADSLPSSVSVTIGQGTIGGLAGGASDGGYTSFGSYVGASGGTGGYYQSTTTAPAIGPSNNPTPTDTSVGDILVAGNAGAYFIALQANISSKMTGGVGGSSPFGAGGSGSRGSNGGHAGGYGAGGGGASRQQNQATTLRGGSGSDGVVVVEHIF